ncbi:MAG: LamG domain-containing protein [Verrucomicrobia bacterium]|nr:LamG domain-containing protein [Verrucomicrobiota bacterium]
MFTPHSTLIGCSVSRIALPGLVALFVLGLTGCGTVGGGKSSELRSALTFHASFDHGLNADWARGDGQLYHAVSTKRPRVPVPGLPAQGTVEMVKDQGRFGHALRFTKKIPEAVFFKAKDNVAYSTGPWAGTVSLWLKVDPARELAQGYCDPIQITPKDWNDASFFVEFEKKTNSIPFRLGAYADFKVWNPGNRKWDDIPFEEKPLTTVLQPPFAGDRWTHVVFTWEGFNTGEGDGLARLYLDGKPAAMLSPRVQTYHWDLEAAHMMIGLSYIGMYDELSVFNRALSEQEVSILHRLPSGVGGLIRR